MKKTLSFLKLLAAILVIAGCTNSTNKESVAPKIDMKLFFKNGEKTNFQISPDGIYFSYIANYKDILNIFVQRKDDSVGVRVTNDTIRSITQYMWKGGSIIFAQDVGGDENFQIFSVNADGTGLKSLTPYPGYRTILLDDLHLIPGKEKEMLIGINLRNKQYFDPYLINIESGKLTLMYDNKENYDSWSTDNNGVIRLATKTDGVNVTYLYRNSDKEKFHELITTSFKETFVPQSFDSINKNIYVLSNMGRDKTALIEFDPDANKEIREIFSQPDYDLKGMYYDKRKKKISNVWWDSDKTVDYYFDKQRDTIISSLLKKFQGYQIYFGSIDDAMHNGIMIMYSDKLPVKYYLYDFKSGSINEIANPYPWLDENIMASMKPISYKTRDGLTIHGYLTLPKGVEAKNLPVIINPHGGPWARDGWYFNPEVQFLANRGYAVLQMNYRGSTGYGKAFWQSSFKQWGKKMQDDITDGVEYLKKEGIADPKRIGIYGGSYGGYATLAGVAFTPDLYTCAVDYVGVANLFTFMNTIPPYWEPYRKQFYEMVGDPEKDSLLFVETSPALHADRIKAPLFIAQGANDPRVNKAESDQMVEALKKRGITVEYMVKNNEGHGFLNQNNRYDFYGAMEKFLDKHMGDSAKKK